MLLALAGTIEKLLDLIIGIREFFNKRDLINQGRIEEKLHESLAANKDLEDVKKANDFEDRLRTDPAFASRVRSILNDRKQ